MGTEPTKSTIHGASLASVPGAKVGGDVLIAIIKLSERIAFRRGAARRLARRCKTLCSSFEQYEKIVVPKRAVQYRDRVFICLHQVKDMMAVWAGKNWFYMLIHEDEYEDDLDDCNKGISDCLLVFNTPVQMEGLVHQEEGERRRALEANIIPDHKADAEQFASPDSMRQLEKNEPTADKPKAVPTILRRDSSTASEHKRKRMAENLHELLRSSGQVPPQLQLNSGEVEWPKERSNGGNVDICKGRYLQREDVRIKVIRSVNMNDEDTVERIRREVKLWAKIHQMDEDKHILPFYGFCSPDGLCLALVSPWMNNGDALAYVKKRDNLKNLDNLDYRKLILGIAEGIKLLHSLFIVHGNLRAENVLIGDEGRPLITEFALTKIEGNFITQSSDQSDSCRWCPPEIFQEQAAVSRKADIYSFGMTILELFTHKIPYTDIKNSTHVAFIKGMGRLPNRPKDEWVIERGLNDSMWELLCKCWSKEPDDRPSIEELVQHLLILPSISATFSLLLATLRGLTACNCSMINESTIYSMCKLLDSYEPDVIASELRNPSDVELLLNFVIALLRNSSLTSADVRDANRKARRLTFKLTSMTNTIPTFLYITNVETEMDLGPFGTGGFGRVFRGTYNAQPVALKVVDQSRHDGSLSKEFLREAIAWRSLSHRFILPLLGIYTEKSQLFLVSPFMKDGTLTQWRKEREWGLTDIHKLMLEVAEGIQYLHSEGIVHGDLHGGNVLLDSTLHCQITDFGSTRHAETTVTQTTAAISIHFAAPELFGMCTKCCRLDCGGHDDKGNKEKHTSKTKETDVYAFGCLYYAIFFGKIPFHENSNYQILGLVTAGKRPERLEHPRMEDNVWDLIHSCMETNPSQRPTMEYIVTTVSMFVQAGS